MCGAHRLRLFSKKTTLRLTLPLYCNSVLFLFLTALSASLPIALSRKIFAWYLIPSTPLFALAFGILILYWSIPFLEHWRFPYRRPYKYGAMFCCAAIVIIGITAFGNPSLSRKNKEILTLSAQLKNKIPPEQAIYTEKAYFPPLTSSDEDVNYMWADSNSKPPEIPYKHPYAYMLRRNCRLYLYCLEDAPSDSPVRYILLKNERIVSRKALLKNYACLLQTAYFSVWRLKNTPENPVRLK